MARPDLLSAIQPLLQLRAGGQRLDPTQSQAQNQSAVGQSLLGGISGLGAVAPDASQQKRNIAGMFGNDVRSPIEKINAQLAQSGADMNTSAGLLEAAKLTNAAGMSQQALQLSALANVQKQKETAALVLEQTAQRERQQALQEEVERRSGILRVATARDAISKQLLENDRIEEANLINSAQTPEQLEKAFTAISKGERYLNIGGGKVFDTATREIISKESVKGASVGTLGSEENEKLQYEEFPDYHTNYATGAYEAAKDAFSTATTVEGRKKALKMIRHKLDEEGAFYRLESSESGEPYYVVDYTPGSKGFSDREANWETFNNAKSRTLANMDNSLNRLNDVIIALDNGTAPTELTGAILSFIPGTDEFSEQANIETLLAQFGLSELEQLRKNSVSGASGLGQLTEKERQVLERRIGNIKRGLSPEKLRDEVAIIISSLARIRDKANEQISKKDWMFGTQPTSEELANTMSVGNVESTLEWDIPGFTITRAK